MKVKSFIRQGLELKPVEVEICLIPGLPKFEIMGLPDAAIKESQKRIRSALKLQGFDLPRGKQILINLKPHHLKKTSRGLELAIATLYLWKTEQVPRSQELSNLPYIYGELGLDGQVTMPDDMDLIFSDLKEPVLTGKTDGSHNQPILKINELKDLVQPEYIPKLKDPIKFVEPVLDPFLSFSPEQAELMAVTALGEHSLMLAGPAGSGKSTIADIIYGLLRPPNSQEKRQIYQYAKIFNQQVEWRPKVNPHHSTPVMSMIGGGMQMHPGEITRAHNGCLILDEFLEFHSQVKEALREPIERGEVLVARQGRVATYPARFQLIATTNLCPCGDLVPNKLTSCRFSIGRCKSYLEKLSGPMLDRFAILNFSHQWKGQKTIQAEEIKQRLVEARAFVNKRGQGQLNSQLNIVELKKQVDPFYLNNLMPVVNGSQRRMLSLFQVARSLADLDQSEVMQTKHMEKSLRLTVRPYNEIKKIF